MVLDIDDIITAGVSKEDIDKARESFVGFQYAQLLDSVLTKLRDDDSETLFALKVRKYLAEIENINTRRHVFYALDNKLRTGNNYEIVNALNRYHYVLESCVYSNELQEEYNQHSKGDVIAYDTSLYYNYIGKDEPNSHSEFLCFSQALYHFSRGKSKYNFDASELPIFVDLFKDKFASSSIIEFCQSLLEAERFRREVCLKKEVPPVTVKDFPIYLRKYCENEYLQHRISEELHILWQNNDRMEPANRRQATKEVLTKEIKAYKDAGNQGEDPEILKMAEYFLLYVKKELGLPVRDEDTLDSTSEDFFIPNFNNQIDKKIKAVYKAKVCERPPDWAAVFLLLVEDGAYRRIEITAGAERINEACGKEVTSARAITNSAAMSIIDGKWKDGGWRDKLQNRTSASKLNHYIKIARVYSK